MRVVKARALTTRPSATVVIPCYNYGHYLRDAVRSALDQAGVDIRVIIVDDASPDGSVAVAHELAAEDSRVEVLAHPTNKGHIATYNDGLALVTTDYLALLSADDVLTRDAVSRAVALMEHHPRVGFVYGYARSFSGTAPLDPGHQRNWTVWSGASWLGVSARRGRCFIASPEVVMRTAAFRDAGAYDARLPHSADFDMWLRTAATWDVGRVNGATQAFYRVHDANMHLTTYDGWLTDLEARRTTFDILFDERAPGLDHVQRLRPTAARALAREAMRRALVSHRDGTDRDATLAYLAFARDVCPAVTRTLTWQLCRVGPVGGRRLPAARVRRFGSRAVHHLAWRRERRYGT